MRVFLQKHITLSLKKKGKKKELSSTDQWKLVSWTDGSSEEENLHVDVNFVEPIDLATK